MDAQGLVCNGFTKEREHGQGFGNGLQDLPAYHHPYSVPSGKFFETNNNSNSRLYERNQVALPGSRSSENAFSDLDGLRLYTESTNTHKREMAEKASLIGGRGENTLE